MRGEGGRNKLRPSREEEGEGEGVEEGEEEKGERGEEAGEAGGGGVDGVFPAVEVPLGGLADG